MKTLSAIWAIIWLMLICAVVAAGLTIAVNEMIGIGNWWANFGVLWLMCLIIIFVALGEDR